MALNLPPAPPEPGATRRAPAPPPPRTTPAHAPGAQHAAAGRGRLWRHHQLRRLAALAQGQAVQDQGRAAVQRVGDHRRARGRAAHTPRHPTPALPLAPRMLDSPAAATRRVGSRAAAASPPPLLPPPRRRPVRPGGGVQPVRGGGEGALRPPRLRLAQWRAAPCVFCMRQRAAPSLFPLPPIPKDGTLVTVEGDAPPAVEAPPTEEDLVAAADAVAAQAALVRSLKEERGLTNQVRGAGRRQAGPRLGGWTAGRCSCCMARGGAQELEGKGPAAAALSACARAAPRCRSCCRPPATQSPSFPPPPPGPGGCGGGRGAQGAQGRRGGPQAALGRDGGRRL
jgi:hypothetical protein